LKAVLKGGFMFYETGRQALAEVAEGIGKPQGTPATHEKESRATQIVRSRKKSDRELIEKVGIAEEQAIGVQAKPRQREKKQRKKAEKQV
jgi:predicted transcriptional regulator